MYHKFVATHMPATARRQIAVPAWNKALTLTPPGFTPVNSFIAYGKRLTSASCVPRTSRGRQFAEPVGGPAPAAGDDAFLASKLSAA